MMHSGAGCRKRPRGSLPSVVSLMSSLGLTSRHSRKNLFIALLGDPKRDKGALGWS